MGRRGQWRQIIGHDGYVVVRLRVLTPEEGGRSRTYESGYRAQWWVVDRAGETWLGEGPLDLLGDRRSLRPGQEDEVYLHPMVPAQWRGVGVGADLQMRERVGKTLGVARIDRLVGVPDDAPLRLDAIPVRPGTVLVRRAGGWAARWDRFVRRFRRWRPRAEVAFERTPPRPRA